MSGDGWDELLDGLDDDTAGENEWGHNFPLEIGTTFVGWWRGQDTHLNKDNGRSSPVYLLRDRDGVDVFIWGARAQLDRKIAAAAPNEGDRIAIRREPDGEAEPGMNPPWRVRVAVLPGEGSMPSPAQAGESDEPAAIGEPGLDVDADPGFDIDELF
jgi:hypothetical protein